MVNNTIGNYAHNLYAHNLYARNDNNAPTSVFYGFFSMTAAIKDVGFKLFKSEYVPSLCASCGKLLSVEEAYYYDYVCEKCELDLNYGAKVAKQVKRKEKVAYVVKRKKCGTLTPRENDVVFCLVHGSTNQQIANELNISKKTVDAHLSQIFKVLGVRNRVKLAVAYVSGLL